MKSTPIWDILNSSYAEGDSPYTMEESHYCAHARN